MLYGITSVQVTRLQLSRTGCFPSESFKDQEPPNLIFKIMKELILLALKFVSAGSRVTRSPDNRDLLHANTPGL